MENVLAPGTRLGRYEIVSRLAMGGMAEIYLARMSGPSGFAKHVVLKRILPNHAQNAEFVRMFHNEARYAATLDHPNIAHVYDLGEEDGLHYYTMEYLHGDDCRALIKAAATRRQPIPLEDAISILVGACNGCHYAHEMTDEDGRPLGLVHRDISPSNVVVTYAGAIKIVDFGIAKATNIEATTAAGGTKGKLAYMAPEQGRGERVDRRADVYALGVLLYELTTLRRAFLGEVDAHILWQVINGEWLLPSAVSPGFPPALEDIIVKAMHVDREHRHASARELQLALEGFARDAGLSLSPTGLGELLESLVGPKLEPWRGERTDTPRPGSLPTPTTAFDDTAPAVAPDPSAQPTYVPVHHAPTRARTVDPGTQLSTASSVSAPAQRPGSGRWIAGGAIVLAGGAAGAYAMWSGAKHREEPPVVMVAERGSAVVEAIDAAEAPPTPTTPTTIDAPDEVIVDGGAAVPIDAGKKPSTPRAVKPAAGDPLSQAFMRRGADVNACFAAHPLGEVQAPSLVLRFEVDTAGTPTAVELTPAELARTPLGGCIVDVARGTRFPAQPEPVVFRIPLALRKAGSKG